MIKNENGFVLAEAIIVAVFILGIFTYLAINIFPLFSKYEEALKYDNPNEVYLANVLYEELQVVDEYQYLPKGLYEFSENRGSISCKLNGSVCLVSNQLSKDYFKELIYNILNIEKILIFTTNSTITVPRSMQEYYEYINKNDFEGKRVMLIQYKNGTFSYIMDDV